MALNFPSSPSVNDVYTSGGRSWRWDGTSWISLGVQGDIGFTGSQGTQGNVGFTGSQGTQGATGFTGSRGATGFTGSAGTNGATGFTGSQGIQGTVGFTGSQGIQGTVGFTGSAGTNGATGFTGSQGAQGTVGFTGSQGIQGTVGFTGSQGNVGFTGSQGTVGFTGSAGTQLATAVFVFDGNGTAITANTYNEVMIPFAATIQKWTLFGDQTGNCVVGIYKDTYANYPPNSADNIAASAKPSITSAIKNQSSILTGWTTSITAGDILRANVESVSNMTKIYLYIDVQR